jgi:hypothetical protein
MGKFSRKHVLAISGIPSTTIAKSDEFDWLFKKDKFTELIDKFGLERDTRMGQFGLKVLSDASHLHQGCVSLLNLVSFLEHNGENLSNDQQQHSYRRLLWMTLQVDSGRCFSPLDPRNEGVKRKAREGVFTVNGFSLDDLTKSTTMRDEIYWVKSETPKNLKKIVNDHLNAFVIPVHERTYKLATKWLHHEVVQEIHTFTNSWNDFIPTTPILSSEKWRVVCTSTPTSAAVRSLNIQNTTNYPISRSIAPHQFTRMMNQAMNPRPLQHRSSSTPKAAIVSGGGGRVIGHQGEAILMLLQLHLVGGGTSHPGQL